MTENERLTHKRMNGIKEGYWSPRKKEELLQRLGKYEDTGMEPEEISAAIGKKLDTDMLQRMNTQIHLLKELRKARKWIPVEERLPEERVNPVSQDFYEYQVTAKFGDVKDVRHYKYGNGHWWNGPGIVDQYVVAWKENPEPYSPERRITMTNREIYERDCRELEQYREIGTVEEFRETREKQIPKEPLSGADINGNEYLICRECSVIVKDGEWKANYCPDCGQAIKWEIKIVGGNSHDRK